MVENRRCRGNRVVQHTVLYLGEINDSQREQWIRAIEVFDEDRQEQSINSSFSRRNGRWRKPRQTG